MSKSELFRGVGIEIELSTPEDFLKIKETLTRIGVVSSEHSKTLYQSCHILHKTDKETNQSRYAIVHFKEMFILDGKPTTFNATDLLRRDVVVNLLEQWNLVKPKTQTSSESKTQKISMKIVPFSQKSDWTFVQKYTIGIDVNKYDRQQTN